MIISEALKSRLLKKIGEEATQKIEELVYDRGDYLDIGVTDETKISYVPVNQYEKFAGDFWNRDLRAEKGVFIKLSKLLTLAGIDNRTISALSVKWGNKTVLTYREMDIKEMYREAREAGLISCMTPYAHEVGIFYENFNVTGVGFFENDEMVARALLWREVYTDDRTTPFPLLDRIYSKSSTGNNLNVQDTVLNIAESNGWAYLTKQAADVSTFWYNGERIEERAFVKANYVIDPDDYFYPYVDTFCSVSYDFKTFATYGEEYSARSTDGDLCGYTDRLSCQRCGTRFSEDEGLELDGNTYCCDECAERDGYTYATIFNPRSQRYIHEWRYDLDDYIYVDSLDAYVYYDYATICDVCGDGVLYEDSGHTTDGSVICSHCVEDYDYRMCEECGQYDKNCEEFEGGTYCPDCLEKVKETSEKEII